MIMSQCQVYPQLGSANGGTKVIITCKDSIFFLGDTHHTPDSPPLYSVYFGDKKADGYVVMSTTNINTTLPAYDMPEGRERKVVDVQIRANYDTEDPLIAKSTFTYTRPSPSVFPLPDEIVTNIKSTVIDKEDCNIDNRRRLIEKLLRFLIPKSDPLTHRMQHARTYADMYDDRCFTSYPFEFLCALTKRNLKNWNGVCYILTHFHRRDDAHEYETTFIWENTNEYEKRKFMMFYDGIMNFDMLAVPSLDIETFIDTDLKINYELYEVLTGGSLMYTDVITLIHGMEFPYSERFKKWDATENRYVPKHISEYPFEENGSFGHIDELLGFRLSKCEFEYTHDTHPDFVGQGPITNVLKIERRPE